MVRLLRRPFIRLDSSGMSIKQCSHFRALCAGFVMRYHCPAPPPQKPRQKIAVLHHLLKMVQNSKQPSLMQRRLRSEVVMGTYPIPREVSRVFQAAIYWSPWLRSLCRDSQRECPAWLILSAIAELTCIRLPLHEYKFAA